MNRENYAHILALMPVALLLCGCATPGEQCGKLPRDLLGTWYLTADPTKPCHIWSSAEGLQVQNEFGMKSRLACDPSGFVIALDWLDGLRGDLRNGAILWHNGSWWSREPVSPPNKYYKPESLRDRCKDIKAVSPPSPK